MSITAGPADAPVARFASLDVAPDLAVLIVSYQSAADLGLLFDSLRAEAVGRRIRVVVADNHQPTAQRASAKRRCRYRDGRQPRLRRRLNAAMSHVGARNPRAEPRRGSRARMQRGPREPHACQRRGHRRTSASSTRSRSRFDVNPASSAHSATPCLAAAVLKLTEVVDSLGLPNRGDHL